MERKRERRRRGKDIGTAEKKSKKVCSRKFNCQEMLVHSETNSFLKKRLKQVPVHIGEGQIRLETAFLIGFLLVEHWLNSKKCTL